MTFQLRRGYPKSSSFLEARCFERMATSSSAIHHQRIEVIRVYLVQSRRWQIPRDPFRDEGYWQSLIHALAVAADRGVKALFLLDSPIERPLESLKSPTRVTRLDSLSLYLPAKNQRHASHAAHQAFCHVTSTSPQHCPCTGYWS